MTEPRIRNPDDVGASAPSPDPGGRRVISSVGFTPRAGGVTGRPAAESERFLARDDLD